MSGYVKFTQEEKDRARFTDLPTFLRNQGEEIKKRGSAYEWLDGSQKVSINGFLWFHQYDRQGGNAVQLVQRFYGKSYPEAVQMLLGGGAGQVISKP